MKDYIEDTEYALANLGDIEDVQIREILEKLYEEESKLSYKRRVIHGRIDILKAELIERLKSKHQKGQSMINSNDVDRLSEILAKGGFSSRVGKTGPLKNS